MIVVLRVVLGFVLMGLVLAFANTFGYQSNPADRFILIILILAACAGYVWSMLKKVDE